MKRMTMTIPEEMYNKINLFSEVENIPKSKIIRKFILYSEFLFGLLEEFGLEKDPSNIIWEKIEEVNKFMEAYRNANK